MSFAQPSRTKSGATGSRGGYASGVVVMNRLETGLESASF